jgi:PleD family two-component response regulator
MAPLNGGKTFPDLFWRRDAMLRILVVDDHADTVDSTVAILKHMGTSPRGCLGGEDAVQQARDFVPQLIGARPAAGFFADLYPGSVHGVDR